MNRRIEFIEFCELLRSQLPMCVHSPVSTFFFACFLHLISSKIYSLSDTTFFIVSL